MDKLKNFKNKQNTNGFDKRREDASKYGGRPKSLKKILNKILDESGEMLSSNIKEMKKNEKGVLVETGRVFEIGKIMLPKAEAIMHNAVRRAIKGSDWQKVYEILEGKPNQTIRLRIEADDFNADLVPIELLPIAEYILLAGAGKETPTHKKTLLLAKKIVATLGG